MSITRKRDEKRPLWPLLTFVVLLCSTVIVPCYTRAVPVSQDAVAQRDLQGVLRPQLQLQQECESGMGYNMDGGAAVPISRVSEREGTANGTVQSSYSIYQMYERVM